MITGLKRRPAVEPRDSEEKEPADEQAPLETVKWSGGPSWAARGVTGVLWCALLTGPLALGAVAVNELGGGDPAPVASSESVDLPAATTAGDTARELVETWLASTQDAGTKLQDLVGSEVSALPESAVPARAITVASVEPTADNSWTVVIAADLEEPAGTDGDQTAWVRRYFQVPVVVARTDAGIGTRATALPAPVAGPDHLEPGTTRFSLDLAADEALAGTVTGFLSSYLAGEGDIQRYVHPGSAVAPVTPAAYAAVEVSSLQGDTASELASDMERVGAPADGDQLTVLVTAILTRADGQKTTAEYVLDLEARATRWEITEISTDTTTTRPATGTPTPEGDQ